MKKNFSSKWFFEKFKPGESKTETWGFFVERKIYTSRSKLQKIEILQSKDQGRVLVLDGLVQLSTRYEHVYHEMLVHPAILSFPNPKNALVIGGGDGGVLREILKYPVKEVFLVEIDKKVIEISKKYLPSVSQGAFSDKRLKIFIEDGRKFIKKYQNRFDLIFLDSTDYFGPAKKLSQTEFLNDVSKALGKNGIFSAQTAYLRIEKFAKKIREKIRKTFPYFQLRRAFVPCFPFDEHTFSLASKELDFKKISFAEIKKRYDRLKIKTKYYSPEIHFASAVLPKELVS
jgi:spermidine synthase